MPTVIESVIIDTANALHLDPYTAIATAIIESNLNPNAVGDNGTSYGLFQLHKGGELGKLTPKEAFDPLTNARTALGHMSEIAGQEDAAMISPGELAALSQRPAHPGSYATEVDKVWVSLCSPAHTRLFRALRVGQDGSDVKALQAHLRIKTDGIFGHVTNSHVFAFQHDSGLDQDGVVGPRTAAALGWTWAGSQPAATLAEHLDAAPQSD